MKFQCFLLSPRIHEEFNPLCIEKTKITCPKADFTPLSAFYTGD